MWNHHCSRGINVGGFQRLPLPMNLRPGAHEPNIVVMKRIN